MKLLFLDFDGVVVPMSWAWGDEYKRQRNALPDKTDPNTISLLKVHPDAVAQLQRIVSETGTRIVISSSWRSHRRNRTNRTWLADLLQKRGLRNARRVVVGITPEHVSKFSASIYVATTRWDEIKAYMGDTTIESFVILDDEAMGDAPKPNFVQTDFMAGLTEVEANRAIEILGRR